MDILWDHYLQRRWWILLLNEPKEYPFFETIADLVQVSGLNIISGKLAHLYLVTTIRSANGDIDKKLHHINITDALLSTIESSNGVLMLPSGMLVEPMLSIELQWLPDAFHMLIRRIVAQFTFRLLTRV